MQAARGQHFFQSERNAGGGGVAVAVEVDEYTLHRHIQPLGGCLNDPQVGLMRNNQRDIVGGHPSLGQDLLRLVGALGGVLGVLHRERLGVAVFGLGRRDRLRDLDVAGENAEVGVAAEQEFDAPWFCPPGKLPAEN